MKNIFKLFLLLTAFTSPFALQAAANGIKQEFNELAVLFKSTTTTFEKIEHRFNELSEADKKALLEYKGNSQETLLHWLCYSNLDDTIKHQTIELFVHNNANINAQDENRITPLHAAALKSHKVVELLLKKNANINAQMENGFTPLYVATKNGKDEIVELLLERGANVNTEAIDGTTPLHSAAENGHDKIVNLLLTSGADVNAQTKKRKTPLHFAAWQGHKKVVETLLLNHADINARIENGLTPLHVASFYGHKEVVDLLLQSGADYSILTNKGESAKDLYNMFIAKKLNQNRLPTKRTLQYH